VFLAHGYAAASMDEVVRVSGVSKATVYAHFPGKRLLFSAIVADESVRFASHAPAGSAGPDGLNLRLLRLGQSVVLLLIAPDTIALYRMVLAEAGRAPEMAQAFHASGPACLASHVARQLEQAMGAGELRSVDPRMAAEHFVALVRGDLQLRALLRVGGAPTPTTVKRTVQAGVEAFCRCYRPDGLKVRRKPAASREGTGR
jgi:AcrR family transcriptional regulator